jgi:hypothetical protein
MPTDPVEEWRRLSTLYNEMGEIEIQELANQISDLTPVAQDVIRDEIKRRGIAAGPNGAPSDHPSDLEAPAVPLSQGQNTRAGSDFDSSAEEALLDYTWKVGLCRCESLDEAAARSEMLRRAGIDSWIQRSGSRFVVPWLEFGVGEIQINVGADQIDQARTILDQPIPQEIIDQLNEEATAPEYELPTCPKCGAPDPILESVEPSNNWVCESCEHTWSDPITEDSASKQSKTA